jgi:NAD(P)-dependent dehydrogenase (short-subunit alcohol dehydrogenase family)
VATKSDPVALVTGASRGIGRQLCVDLAAAGWDVVCAARTTREVGSRLPGTVDDTAAAVQKTGRRAMAVGLDVQDEAAVAALAERVYGAWGRCDLVVNNAAVAPPKPALEDTIKRWKLAVDVNVNGPFYTSYHFGRRMRDAGEGRIINVSSLVSVRPEFGRPSYTATKRALEGLTEALAHELRGRVAVNCIRIEIPIWTEGFDATLPKDYDMSAFEDPVVMSDATLWMARQDLSYTGNIVEIGQLRAQGVVRPFTAARRS